MLGHYAVVVADRIVQFKVTTNREAFLICPLVSADSQVHANEVAHRVATPRRHVAGEARPLAHFSLLVAQVHAIEVADRAPAPKDSIVREAFLRNNSRHLLPNPKSNNSICHFNPNIQSRQTWPEVLIKLLLIYIFSGTCLIEINGSYACFVCELAWYYRFPIRASGGYGAERVGSLGDGRLF